MRRAVILATLTVLLIAVAGVTVARENTSTPTSLYNGQPESTAPDTTTVPETTSPETTAPQSTTPDEPDEKTVEKTVERTVETTVETTVVEPSAPEETLPVVEQLGEPEMDEEAGKPDYLGKPDELGKPEKVKGGKKNGKLRGMGKLDDIARLPGKGNLQDAGKPEKEQADGNPGKVTLCHKDKVAISVGAPAEPARLRHGDSLGAC